MYSRKVRRFALALSSLLVVAAAAAGCKPGAEDLCERYVKAQCRFQYGCCNASERQRVGLGFGQVHHNEETCNEELTRIICSSTATYADSERAGRSMWDSEKSNACLGTIETAANECDAEAMQGSTLGDECALSEMVTGLVADGDDCFESFECANEEAVCVQNEPDDEDEQLITEKGTCTPPPAVGEECPDYICEQDAWCDITEDPAVCKAKQPNGEDCSSGLQCVSGICDFSAGQGVCGPKKPNGEPCVDHAECASEFCDRFATGACEDKRAAGEPCDEDEACASDYCDYNTSQCALADEEQVQYDICRADEQ